MFVIRNSTPYAATAVLMTDKDGRDVLVAIAKATFIIDSPDSVQLAEVQVPPVLADQYHADAGTSSLKAASDFALFKPAADVIVLGSAVAPPGKPAKFVDVSLNLGSIRKSLRVFGDRRWQRGLMSMKMSDPLPFETMPITFERAFGGKCKVRDDAEDLIQEDRNPVGAGFWNQAAQAADQLLPNVEDPKNLVSAWKDRPAPSGFSFVAGDWLPRRALAGSYDGRWQKHRMPLLPEDFDYRYFNAAPADQQVNGYLEGGERVELRGFAAHTWSFDLPTDLVEVELLYPMEVVKKFPTVLDTVVLEPDLRRVQMVWRAKIPTPDQLTHVLHIDFQSRNAKRKRRLKGAVSA